MKKSIFPWLRSMRFPLLLLLSIMPLLLHLLCIDAPHALNAAYILFAAFMGSSGVCLLVPAAWRIPSAAVCSALMIALCAFTLPLGEHPGLLFLPAALCAALFLSLPLAVRRHESEVPPFIYLLGVGIHLFVQFLRHYFTATSGENPYIQADPLITASLIGYLLLLLLFMNAISLNNASLGRHHVPKGIQRLNMSMTLAFFAAALLLSLVPAVVRGIKMLWALLRAGLARVGELILSLLPEAADMGNMGGGPTQALNGAPLENTPPGFFAQLIEKIATVLSLVIIVTGTLALLWLIFRLLKRLYRSLLARVRLYMTAASAEYEDEITDTREDGAAQEIHRTREEKRRAQEMARTPQGRIRQAYARLLRRNTKWSVSSTARENLPSSAADIYERARYSEHTITDADAARFHDDIKRI